jgi:hypothetical protein
MVLPQLCRTLMQCHIIVGEAVEDHRALSVYCVERVFNLAEDGILFLARS